MDRIKDVDRAISANDYVLDVSVNGNKGSARRLIQINSQSSLYKLAQTIVAAFDFEFDHCFGFYDTLDRKRQAKKVFEYFPDVGEDPTVPWAKSVKRSKVSEAFQSIGEKMIFLFDYGDGWQFFVRLAETRANSGSKKLIILESSGETPEQYPPCDD